jgi:flagellar motor switch/type III secretory pathway protein FliN
MSPGWIGDTTLQAAHARVLEALSIWARQWGCDTPSLSMERLPQGFDVSVCNSSDWLENTEKGVWVMLPRGLAGAFQRVLFRGCEEHSPVAQTVSIKAAEALRSVLLTALPVSQDQALAKNRSEPATQGQRPVLGHWGIRGAVSVDRVALQFLASTASLSRAGLLSSPRAAALPAAARSQAVARVPVSLTLRLGTSSVSVADLSALRVGDVVIADALSTAPLSLDSPHGEILAKAVLGRSGGRRAAQLLPF